MPGSHTIGIDGGGTQTRAVVIDAAGDEISRAVSGPSNIHSAGQQVAEASLRQAIDRVLAGANLAPAAVSGIGLGLAGAARPDDQRTVRAILSRIACFSRVVFTHDAEAALVGGIGRRYGAVLIAGTGAIAYGVNARGEARRTDGWGYLLGDEGSAYWIGREGLRAAMRAHDGRGPATDLQRALPSYLGLDDAGRLVTRVYAEGFGAAQVAGLALRVRQAAEGGDAVARRILEEAGQWLVKGLRAIIHGLGMADETFEVVLTGGVLASGGPVREAVCASLGEIAPQAKTIEPRHDAAHGAALLARRAGE